MKMVVAIVHPDSSENIIKRLSAKGYGSTSFASQGSFLQTENRTFMIVVSDDRVQEVISMIREETHWKKASVAGKDVTNSMIPGDFDTSITVSGATIFVLNVEQFQRV